MPTVNNRHKLAGKSFPLGSSLEDKGTNFSVFSKNAHRIDLLLFNHVDDSKPSRVIELDPIKNKTFDYWHCFVPKIGAGQIYAFRAHGLFEPELGMRFDGQKVLLDPYGKGLSIPKNYSRKAACEPGDNARTAMKSVVVDMEDFDWEGDLPINRPFRQTVIYEMHVRGFTQDHSSCLASDKRGTYAGLIEKIPYLKDLGITAVELLPVYQFDEEDAPLGLRNYWGYSTVSFFVPHARYSFHKSPMGVLNEFRLLVKALHRAGIEVILDVAYNHTAEGNHNGPSLCYRGLENSVYYLLEKDKRSYSNFSGTGNTFNANHPVVRRLILDSLRYWVEYMHVDGFRFDLASIFSRDETGIPVQNPPVIWDIDTDPRLAGTKLIAEAWDCGGLYQVGSFVGDNWIEWNGRFRDDARRFIKSDPGVAKVIPARILASPDIYMHKEQDVEHNVNFITCHDGFTLNDLVSYNQKHNKPNKEKSADGSNDNLSWNCGSEGPTRTRAVEDLRNRQVKNFFTLNLLSLGVPMILMGDEVRRTQGGNNNAYSQDNESSWFDWKLLDTHADVHRFVKKLISMRMKRVLANDGIGTSLNMILRNSTIEWHGQKLRQPDWSDESRYTSFTVKSYRGSFWLHAVFNAHWEPYFFELPKVNETGWYRIVDTYLESPRDICDWKESDLISEPYYPVFPRSVALLIAWPSS